MDGQGIARAVAQGTLLLLVGACSSPEPARSPETLAVEALAGDFMDYYEEVLRLAKRHGANPDSFRAGLEALPGSHLTDEEWEVWAAPYQDHPAMLAERLEEILAELSRR